MQYAHLFACTQLHLSRLCSLRPPCLGNGAAHSWQGSPEDELLLVLPLQPSAENLSLKLFPGDASGVDIANHRR